MELARITRIPTLKAAALLAAVLVLWVAFAPWQLGGPAAYVIVNGNSMEPTLLKGDLVILRRAPAYQVGDIITYKYPEIGPVIHRIVDREGDTFILQGDHNSWTDGYQPIRSEILGKYWFHLPRAGKFLTWMRNPFAMAGFVALACIFFGMTWMENSNKPLKKRRATRKSAQWIQPMMQKISARQEGYYFVFYGLAFIGALLAFFAFTRPLTIDINDDYAYQHNGTFGYNAEIIPGVYDNNLIQSGDAMYPQLNCDMNLTFDYKFSTEATSNLKGTAQINAVISESNGWHRTLELVPPTAFSGSSFNTAQTVDLCGIEKIITQMQDVTGVTRSQYTLNILPEVQLEGSLAGLAFSDTFDPSLNFIVESEQVYLFGGLHNETNSLTPTQAGLITKPRSIANTLQIFGLALEIKTARLLSALILLVAAIGIALPEVLISKRETGDETTLARHLLGPLMVEASGFQLNPGDRLIQIGSLAELARLAQKFGTVVLFQADGVNEPSYLVHDQNVIYSYKRTPLSDTVSIEVLTREMQTALQYNQFSLYFQPVVSLSSGKIEQVEALLRWRHPERGVLTPADFLPAAVQSGLIEQIDAWVLRESCMQVREWLDQGITAPTIAINFAPNQFREPNLGDMISGVLAEYNLPSSYLQIEANGKELTLDEHTLSNLRTLRKLGVNISFNQGSELSSENMQLFNDFNVLKFDRTLVQKLPNDSELMHTTLERIRNAHTHKVKVIAVGIETNEQFGFFRMNDCDEAQGYFISPPLPVEALTSRLRDSGAFVDVTAKPVEG